jgi:hypothetical protein
MKKSILTVVAIFIAFSLSGQLGAESRKRLDSVIHCSYYITGDNPIKFGKTIVEYNMNGNPILSRYFCRDFENSGTQYWLESTRYSHDYRRWASLTKPWNTINHFADWGKTKLLYRIETVYDLNANVTTEYCYGGDHTTGWELLSKMDYDRSKPDTLILLGSFIISDSLSRPSAKIIKTYDEFSHLRSEEVFELVDDLWKSFSRDEYEFSGNRIISHISSKISFDYETDSIKDERWITIYVYGNNLKLISEEIYNWRFSSGYWGLYDSYEWVYYDAGIAEKKMISRDEEQVLERLEYDPFGNLIYHMKIGSENSGSPTEDYMYEYHYDSEGYLISDTEQMIQGFMPPMKVTVARFYYYSISSGIDAVISDNLDIFPNPTSGIINITGLSKPAEVRLFSLHGRLLKKENLVESSIDISDLPAGIYILNLTSGNTQKVEQIIRR